MKREELTKTFMMILDWKKNPSTFMVYTLIFRRFNPFKPEFTIVIHYKPRIAVAIPDL